jgi:type I restriction enzyme S subunit
MTGAAVRAGKRATYPAYKPSGVTWLGDVPAHWDVRRLKYTASINDEALPETTDPDYEFTYVDIGSVDAIRGIVATETHRFENAPSRARRIVRDGDTIVSTVRTYLRAIAAIRDPQENLIVSTGFAVVRPRKLDPGYLSYALRSPFFVDTVVSRSTGVSYPAINAPEVGNIGITLPSLAEQRAIAAFLDRETARIDALIEKKRRQIELLQEKRSALISHAVTKGLDPNAPMKPSGIEWLGLVPKHWAVVRVRRIGRVCQGRSFPHSIQGSEHDELAWYKVDDMNRPGNEVCMQQANNYVSTDVACAAGAAVLPAETIIFPRVGAALLTNKRRILVCPAIVDDNIYAVIPSRIQSRYLYYLLSLVDFASLASPGLVRQSPSELSKISWCHCHPTTSRGRSPPALTRRPAVPTRLPGRSSRALGGCASCEPP